MADESSSALTDYARAVNKAIGRAIREARDKLDLTQESLAEKVGVSRGSIANIERGGQTVSVPLLLRLAHALQVAPSRLLRVEDLTEIDWRDAPGVNEEVLEGMRNDREKSWLVSLVRDREVAGV